MSIGDVLVAEFGGHSLDAIVRAIDVHGRLLVEIMGGEADGIQFWIMKESVDES